MDKTDNKGKTQSSADDADSGLPCKELLPGHMSPEDRFDAWFDTTAELCDISITTPSDRSRGVVARSWMLDHLMFLDAHVIAHTASRSKRHLRQSECDTVTLIRGYGNPSHLVMENEIIEQDAGSWHLTDYSREHVEHCEEESYSCVYLPYQAIGYDPLKHPAHMQINPRTPAGRLLTSAYQTLHDQLDFISQQEAESLASGFSALVGSLFLTQTQKENDNAHPGILRKQAISLYIEDHLDNPDLNVTKLESAFSIPRATLYRDFKNQGGLSNYIYNRRLKQAYLNPGRHLPLQ